MNKAKEATGAQSKFVTPENLSDNDRREWIKNKYELYYKNHGRTLFNCKESTELYRRCRITVAQLNILKISTFNVDSNGESKLILCDTVMLKKDKKGIVRCYIRDFDSFKWVKIKPCNLFHFSIQPVNKNVFLSKSLISYCVKKIVEYHNRVLRTNQSFVVRIEKSLSNKLIKQSKLFDVRSGEKAAVYHLYKNIICSDFLKIVMILNYRVLSLSRYITLNLKKDVFFRVHKERKNLIPLLKVVPVSLINRDDLFSRRLWVRGDRARTPLDRAKKIYLEPAHKTTKSFSTNAGWKWISNASPIIVSQWSNILDYEIIDIFSKVSYSKKIPVRAYTNILKRIEFINRITNIDKKFIFVASYLRFSADVFEEVGYMQYIKIVRTDPRFNIYDVADFVRSNEYIFNKKSTWRSLLEQSELWHRDIHLRSVVERTGLSLDTHLGDPAMSLTISDGSIKLVETVGELFEEGRRMRHCVSMYTRDCYDGIYAVFKVDTGNQEERATLGCVVEDNGNHVIEQVRGVCNLSVSKKIDKMCTDFIKKYNKKIKEVKNEN